jgi:hypothetical protein
MGQSYPITAYEDSQPARGRKPKEVVPQNSKRKFFKEAVLKKDQTEKCSRNKKFRPREVRVEERKRE